MQCDARITTVLPIWVVMLTQPLPIWAVMLTQPLVCRRIAARQQRGEGKKRAGTETGSLWRWHPPGLARAPRQPGAHAPGVEGGWGAAGPPSLQGGRRAERASAHIWTERQTDRQTIIIVVVVAVVRCLLLGVSCCCCRGWLLFSYYCPSEDYPLLLFKFIYYYFMIIVIILT